MSASHRPYPYIVYARILTSSCRSFCLCLSPALHCRASPALLCLRRLVITAAALVNSLRLLCLPRLACASMPAPPVIQHRSLSKQPTAAVPAAPTLRFYQTKSRTPPVIQ
ncbi:MAG: hypothetical protein LBB61_07675, partial [Treponema sp.]|nr:hypothetical protein [Treponema sp.]